MSIEELQRRVSFLEDRVKILDDENTGTTNALYELENRMQAQIDALVNYTMLNRQVLEDMHGITPD